MVMFGWVEGEVSCSGNREVSSAGFTGSVCWIRLVVGFITADVEGIDGDESLRSCE